jgi:hypothetical protein
MVKKGKFRKIKKLLVNCHDPDDGICTAMRLCKIRINLVKTPSYPPKDAGAIINKNPTINFSSTKGFL